MKNWKNKYPISTITGTTYDELVEFIDGLLKQKEDECRKGRAKEIMEAIKLASVLKV